MPETEEDAVPFPGPTTDPTDPVVPIAPPAALTHIEKTLADAYRKEIDQEENVWRTLPFFAATLALQLAAVFQLLDKLPPKTTAMGIVSIVILVLAGLTALTATGFLAASIFPRRFSYLAPDPDLLKYALDLVEDEKAAEPGAQSALLTLQKALAEQYARGAHTNRQINKRREWLRSIAGLATILALILTLFLVGVVFLTYIPPKPQGVSPYAEQPVVPPSQARGASPAGASAADGRPSDPAARPPGAP
jgi:hypothetical protein